MRRLSPFLALHSFLAPRSFLALRSTLALRSFLTRRPAFGQRSRTPLPHICFSVSQVLGVALALFSFGCAGSPTPLAPNWKGSVGLPHSGVLTISHELPLYGNGFERFRRFGTFNYGHPDLVKALKYAAEQVQTERPGGGPLIIGDLSAKTGGKIPRHNSHRTGRDVDLLWYVTTPLGAPLKSPGFIRLGDDGLGRVDPHGDYVRLDIPRQWALVRALITNPYANVQLMFCSRAIEAMLINYARARGESATIIWRAETLLLEPADSLPHDDHIHLRMSCPPSETIDGCEGGGPYWDWLPSLPSLRDFDAALLAEIRDDDPISPADENATQDSGNEEQESSDSGVTQRTRSEVPENAPSANPG